MFNVLAVQEEEMILETKMQMLNLSLGPALLIGNQSLSYYSSRCVRRKILETDSGEEG